MVEIKAAALSDESLDSPGGLPLIICTNAPRILRKVSQRGYQHLHLNTELSKALMSHPAEERPSQIEAGIKTLIPIHSAMLVSEFEMLFDPRYKIDVLKLFCERAKSSRIAIVWPGMYENGKLSYAQPEDPDYNLFYADNYQICIVR